MNPLSLLAATHDVCAALLAWALAFWLRLNLSIPEEFVPGLLRAAVVCVPIQAWACQAFGLYQGVWRYASLPDLRRIVFAVATGALAGPFVLMMLGLNVGIPRSTFLLEPMLLLLIMGGSRFAYRSWKEHRQFGAILSQGAPVLVVGTGDAAVTLVKELSRSAEWRIVGLIDDDPRLAGRVVHDARVVGTLATLADEAARLSATHVILARPEATHHERRRVVETCRAAGLTVLTIPAFDDLMSGRVQVSAIRKVELDDLLGRDPVQLDSAGLTGLIANRTVLVSGAGGSIGSELVRQIARFSPGLMVLVDSSEFALYNIEQEFARKSGGPEYVCVVGDVRDAAHMREVMARWRPAVVFHAAAYKHVPLMENENAREALANNVAGTASLARASIDAKVDKFVLISTDKAVNPTNVMGASKRLAELVCQSLDAESVAPDTTRFVMVRFGNVLGSTGSVIPKFREQIAAGGPVTVTHPDIVRYFMSIPEAAQLVLQAALMGRGGEIFVLDMGEPVKIVELAREMIRLSGLAEDEIRIEYTGLRPGEKLFEELLADNETSQATPHAKLRIARPAPPPAAAWREDLLAWIARAPIDPSEVRAELARRLPEYKPAVTPTALRAAA
ncbi:MAG: polysaccharide biosynthesis protein [Burkholderiales bacterium]|nr:polysaccharide biosynthesis protein [Burkholderiales bacterium]